MTALKEPIVSPPAGAAGMRLFRTGRTLDDLIRALRAQACRGSATCPVCAGAMRAHPGSGVLECAGCGSVLETDPRQGA